MKLEPDKVVHLKWAAAGAVALSVLLLVALMVHPALAVAAAGPLLAIALERYQVARGGTADRKDMPYTAAPFLAAGVAWWLLW